MLNHIEDKAAEDLLNFYRSLLKEDIKDEAKFKAHYTIGLLLWRNQGQAAIKDITAEFRLAAKEAIELVSIRKPNKQRTSEDVFDFMAPVFVAFVFGTLEDRTTLTKIHRSQWAPPEDENFQPLIELLDMLRSVAVSREINNEALHIIVQANQHYGVHPFYRPWISELTDALNAIAQGNGKGLEAACNELYDLHEEEALYASLKTDIEGLLCFWLLIINVFAKSNGMNFIFESPYIPEIDNTD